VPSQDRKQEMKDSMGLVLELADRAGFRMRRVGDHGATYEALV
jgi:hypothetical protein